jgi:Fe-S-cluster containining protein
VYVSDADLTALAAELGQSEQEVEQQFCDHEDGWRFLKRASGACVFLTEKGLCGVYKARPKQCGTWPYWEDNIATEKKWVDAVKSFCPGIGKGEVTPADDVQRIARETEEWYEG